MYKNSTIFFILAIQIRSRGRNHEWTAPAFRKWFLHSPWKALRSSPPFSSWFFPCVGDQCNHDVYPAPCHGTICGPPAHTRQNRQKITGRPYGRTGTAIRSRGPVYQQRNLASASFPGDNPLIREWDPPAGVFQEKDPYRDTELFRQNPAPLPDLIDENRPVFHKLECSNT